MRATLAATLLGAASVLARPAPVLEQRSSPSDPSSVIVQLFEWTYDSVAAECPTLAATGYKYVQVSPAAEHIAGSQWWTSYQRVSAQLVSKHGNRDQLASMIATCSNAGVGVIVDVVLNHMTAGNGTGVAGSQHSQYQYPGLYSGFDFHYEDQCGSKDQGVDDWSNITQIQFCQLEGMADLKTESEYVRQSLADHLNDILSLGAAGFRLDAAKHIPTADLQSIWGRLSRTPYAVQEVINQTPAPPASYVQFGTVTITKSYAALEAAFLGTAGPASLNGWENGQNVASDAAAVFVATHDSERGDVGGSLTVDSPHNGYTLASVFQLAYPYGTPTVLSSYAYKTRDDGPPNGGAGACAGAAGAAGFHCQHRWTAIANMVRFRKAAGAAALVDWQAASGTNQRVAFGRGSAGFVAINNADSAWAVTLNTHLPAGTYCDVVAGAVSGAACTGSKATVAGGKITLSVPARGALAFYTGAQPGAAKPTTSKAAPPKTASTSKSTPTTSKAAPTPTPTSVPAAGRPVHPAGLAGKCLDVKDGVFADGSLVQLWDCGGNAQEQFVLPPSGGSGHVQLAGTNFCFDGGSSPVSGTQLKIWTCYDGLAAQQWSFTNGGQLSNQGQCIDITDSKADNGNILQTWECTAGDTNQLWTA